MVFLFNYIKIELFSADQLSNNSYSKRLVVTNINIDDLNNTGFYFLSQITQSHIGTYPSNMNSFAAHLIQLSEGKKIDNAKFQIITEYNNTYKIWIRKSFDKGQNISVYTDWKQIYPDYTDISLNNGFIVFNNGLILQWGNGGVTGESVSSSFPIAFTIYPSFVGIADVTWARNHNLTTTTWGLYFAANTTIGYRWIAIGK